MRRVLLPLLLASAPAVRALDPALSPAPVRFEAVADRTAVAVGDRVVVTYSARLPEGAAIALDALVTPAPGENAPPGGGAVLEFENPKPATIAKTGEKGVVLWKRSIALAPFASGVVTIPGPRLLYVSPSGEQTLVRPPSLTLEVASRLPKERKAEELSPKADRGARVPGLGPWFWGSVLAGILALATLVFWLVKRQKGGATIGIFEKPRIPPGAEFLAALEKLAADAAKLNDDPRAFYSDLTHVTKRYLERTLEQPVLEWTTFETMRRLRDQGIELPREIAFSELLSAADRVKFGKGGATREDARQHLTRARMLHDHMEARQSAAAAAAASGQNTRQNTRQKTEEKTS